ncbi:MAG: hypothetical protein DI637_08620 [Citromicrobium sp.]|nr:MAG: hypothetical protein DI637_08620 [Citromicrobium sp.]
MRSKLTYRLGLAGLAALPLAGCGPPDAAPDIAEQGGEPVECALDGAEDFSADCMVMDSGGVRVVFHPDGGFRRLEGGSLPTSYDGADVARSQTEQGFTVVSIGDDRYRFPAQAGDE